MYVEPGIGSFDPDYGSFTGDGRDPRTDPAEGYCECPVCHGDGCDCCSYCGGYLDGEPMCRSEYERLCDAQVKG